MKNIRIKRSARPARMLFAVTTSMVLLNSASGAAFATLDSDTVGMYGSVLMTRSADKAARAMKAENWSEAQGEYIKLAGLKPNEEDFYVGLYCSSHKLGQWDQVMRALKELFALRPEYKEKMTLEYGEACYHLNRYDEAEVYLKKALSHVTDESFMEQRMQRVLAKGMIEIIPVVGPIKPGIDTSVPAPIVYVPTIDDPRKALTLENAFLKSEVIIVCTYKRYEKTDRAITFHSPPKAIFHIEEVLKTSSKLNPTIPIRFEFHEDLKEETPKGWAFTPDKMPQKDSKWVIFIENCVPVDGMYKTYHGKFGIIPYVEETYDKVLKIIKDHQGQS